MTTWCWEYFPAGDQWQLHAPDYEPEVSWIVRRIGGQRVVSRNTATTMPVSVQRIVQKIAEQTDFYSWSDRKVCRIELQGEEVKKYARRLDQLMLVWESKKMEQQQAAVGGH